MIIFVDEPSTVFFLVSLFVIAYLLFLVLVFLKALDHLVLSNQVSKYLFAKGQLRIKKDELDTLLLTAPLALLAFVIPYYRVASSIPSILLVLACTVLIVRKFNFSSLKVLILKNAKIYFILIAGYLLFISLHSILFQGDFQKVQLNFLLLFYLVAFVLLKETAAYHFRTIGKFYLLGTLGFIPFILVLASTQFTNLSWNAFYYTDLLDSIKANPITHSLYFNIAIIIAAKFWKESTQLKAKTAYAVSLFALLFMLMLFGSKTGYLTACLSLSFLALSLIQSKIAKLVFMIAIPLSLFFIYENVPYINKKVKGFKWQITRHEKIILEHRLPRSVIWPEAIQLIKASPIKGYGLGRSFDVLSERYLAIDYPKGVQHRFNAHNQFLESLLQIGIIGGIWWLVLILYLIYASIKYRNVWLAHFLFLLICYLLVESLLESQMGMVAVAFFLPYFLWHQEKAYLK